MGMEMGVSRYTLILVAIVVVAALASVVLSMPVLAQTYIELQDIVPLKVWQYDVDSNLYVMYGENISTGTYYVFLYDASTNTVIASMSVAVTSVYLIDYDSKNHYLFVYNAGAIDQYNVTTSGFVKIGSIPTPNNNANAFVAVGTYSRLVVIDEPNLYAYIIAYNGTVIASDTYCYKARPIGVDYTRGYVLMGQPSTLTYRICLVKVADGVFVRAAGPAQDFTVYRAGIYDAAQGLWVAVKYDGSIIIFFNESALGSPVEVATNMTMSGVAFHGFSNGTYYWFAGYDGVGVHVYRVEYNGTELVGIFEEYSIADKSYPELSRDPSGGLVLFYYDPYAGKPAVVNVAQVLSLIHI